MTATTDTIIAAAPDACVWVAANEWKGPDDVWPRIYRVPVVAWRIGHGSHHGLPVVIGTELPKDQMFLLRLPDGQVSIGTLAEGWHSDCPNLESALQWAGIADG